MLSDQEQIIINLKSLHMPTIRRSYEKVAKQARADSWSYEQYLLELLNFDKKRLPAKVANHLNVLVNGSFLNRSENILAFGNPGSGKTHLLCAIGHALIERGKKVLFITCGQLVQDLLIAKRELEITKKLKKLSKFDAVIIDDIGYVQQRREEMEVLFTFLADRYEQGSLMITSNLPFSKWEF